MQYSNNQIMSIKGFKSLEEKTYSYKYKAVLSLLLFKKKLPLILDTYVIHLVQGISKSIINKQEDTFKIQPRPQEDGTLKLHTNK